MDRETKDSRESRAAARRSWPIRVFRLGEEPEDNLLETTTAAERLAMQWAMTLDTWSLSGRPIPDYPRSEAPIRVLRSGICASQVEDESPRPGIAPGE